jgi:SAM-dependent methyltransferase
MFSNSAEFYDAIYGKFKDYPAEAKKIADLIAREHPDAKTLLDVACGSGEHARILREQFHFKVDGIDRDGNFVALAEMKNPGNRFFRADMVDFDLGRAYDVVMCLFSSIAYVRTLDRVTLALRQFKAHLNDGGLILVEPWFPPGVLTPGKIHLNSVHPGDVAIARLGYCEIRDRMSTLHFEYLIGTLGKIRHETETHDLGLFTREEMGRCFAEAGLSFVFDPDGLTGRGLYVARKARTGSQTSSRA